ncbi:hypothetical protein BJY52DRAFT_1414726 [Lactarius psammicola]|nr:hypothetical protein BJY52DRAFT_1414726 [Lactarius psammicola]
MVTLMRTTAASKPAKLTQMMTFLLEPADGEHGFKEMAWSNRGRYTITGSWSKGENEVTEIKFKMTYQGVSWFTFFNDRFDAERDALTGVWGWGLYADAENSIYPYIKELSNMLHALWGFAISAVRGDMCRGRRSWSYFAKCRKDREAVIFLGIRYSYFGRPLNNEEDQLFSAAKLRLTAADAYFYASEINHTLGNTRVHENECNWCQGRLDGVRLFCLDCDQRVTEFFDLLDPCCAQECMAARITHRQDLKVPHEPNHGLVKVPLAAFKRVKTLCTKIQVAESSQKLEVKYKIGEEPSPSMKNLSSPEPIPEKTGSEQDNDKPCDDPDAPGGTTVGIKEVAGTSQDPSGEDSQGRSQPRDDDPPPCGNLKCKGDGRHSFPCWYCIYCEDNLFLCDLYDRESVPDFNFMRGSGKHTEDHHLIRCLTPEKEEDTSSPTVWRLISLEDRLNSMQSLFDDLTHLTQDLTSRMGNMEQLLHRIAAASETLRS